MANGTKIAMYAEAQKLSNDNGFIANVILTQHSNPTAKLRGLVKLLKEGHEVRTGQFSIDTLVIDGRVYGWEVLESPVLVSRWHDLAPVA